MLGPESGVDGTAAAESHTLKRNREGGGRRSTATRNTRHQRHARGSPPHSPRRRHNTQAQNANAAPPVRRLDAVGPQRLGRLAPLHLDRSVAPARRPRLAPAFTWCGQRRTDCRHPRCFIAVQGGRSFVNSDAGEADAVSTKEQQRDAATKAPGDGAFWKKRPALARVPVS